MSLRTSKDMLDFLINSHKPKTSTIKSIPNQIATTRDVNISKRPQSKNRTFRKYYECRARPIDIIEPSIQAQLSSQDYKSSETSSKKINTSQQKHSHKVINTNRAALVQFDTNHYSQNRITKRKVQLTPYRFSRMTHYDLQKQQDLVINHHLVNHSHDVIKNRTFKNQSQNNHTKQKQDILCQLKKSKYYIQQVKRSVHEYLNNGQYINPYLSQVMDSISAFHTYAHTPIPKQSHKTIELPHVQNGKITLLFDLDETLVHTQVMNWDTKEEDMGWGTTIQICTENGDYLTNLKIRPHAVEMLNKLKEHFQLGIFTASQEHYGSKILQVLDPNNSIFSFKLYRQHCFEMHSRASHVKDLRILKNRDLAKVILIDNSPYTYLFQKNNAIPITSFFSDRQDTQLLRLQTFLLCLKQVKDVREVLKAYFKLDQYHHYSNMLKLIRQIY